MTDNQVTDNQVTDRTYPGSHNYSYKQRITGRNLFWFKRQFSLSSVQAVWDEFKGRTSLRDGELTPLRDTAAPRRTLAGAVIRNLTNLSAIESVN